MSPTATLPATTLPAATPRADFAVLAPRLYRSLASVNAALADSALGRPLLELVFLRISQLNGCAYCVDQHARELLAHGEDAQRINSLVTWHEVPFYSERERAALAWAESITLIGDTHAPDADYAALTGVFDEHEIVELSYAIALMNAWNRLAIGLRKPVERRPALHAQPTAA